jgi:hypothetical protein
LVGGHEGAGVVVARGSLVHDVEIGDHAGVKVRLPFSLQIISKRVSTDFLYFSGSTAHVSTALSANNQMSRSALKPSSPATPLTVPSNNTALLRLHTLPVFPRNATSRPLHQSSVLASPFTRD